MKRQVWKVEQSYHQCSVCSSRSRIDPAIYDLSLLDLHSLSHLTTLADELNEMVARLSLDLGMYSCHLNKLSFVYQGVLITNRALNTKRMCLQLLKVVNMPGEIPSTLHSKFLSEGDNATPLPCEPHLVLPDSCHQSLQHLLLRQCYTICNTSPSETIALRAAASLPACSSTRMRSVSVL